ncbi:serine/threonine protein kinase [Dietzia sp. 2505]|uniref:serine/threonine-protein kinase n=1 Tax=Dietzia sp. 2505 TaxID=3156457 RepID=UPI003391013B
MDVGTVVDGAYEILGPLGSGGSGTVWKVRHKHLNRIRALKVIEEKPEEPALYERFELEARSAGSLDHPNIVKVHEFRHLNDSPIPGHAKAYLVMDYVPGKDLRHYIVDSDILSVEEKVRIIRDAALALHYAHGKNIIHRDVKPANLILCAETDLIKLTDFGIAKVIGDARALTITGYYYGSPGYVAPEVERGDSPSPASDVYSLGIVAGELLGHKTLISGEFANVAKVIETALKRLPEHGRYSTAAQFATEFTRAYSLDVAAGETSELVAGANAKQEESTRRLPRPAPTRQVEIPQVTTLGLDDHFLFFSLRSVVLKFGEGLERGSNAWRAGIISCAIISSVVAALVLAYLLYFLIGLVI